MNDARRLVDFALRSQLSDLDVDARARAAALLMDTVAVGVAGSSHPAAPKIVNAVQRWGTGREARVLGRAGLRLPPGSAALLNGFQIHCLEWDGLHDDSVVIALCVTTAALLAEIEVRPTTGADLLLAFAVGVETAVFAGAASRSQPRFFRPAICGLLGAALAVARLRRLTTDQALDAFGLAYSQLSGTMQAHWEGAENLALQVGFAARAALAAADLAEAGLGGPHDVLTGKFGFFSLFETATDISQHLDRLGRPWKIGEISHKPFPAGRASQATLTALRGFREEKVFSSAWDIAEIRVHAPPLIHVLVGRPAHDEMSLAYARLCLQFIAPLYLLHGRVDPRLFCREVYSNPELRALGRRVVLADDGNIDPNALGPQRVELRMKDGRVLVREVAAPLGSPANPLDRAGQMEKVALAFELAATPLRPTPFAALFDGFDTLPDAAIILDHTTANAGELNHAA